MILHKVHCRKTKIRTIGFPFCKEGRKEGAANANNAAGVTNGQTDTKRERDREGQYIEGVNYIES